MFTRDNNYYGIVNDGLSYIGYTGATAFSQYVEDTFAKKYNVAATFSQLGFGIDPNLPINPTFEQLELTVRPYTMAAYVDIDSDGPTKSTDGATLQMGKIPTFKHEVTMTRKTMRELAMLRERIGKSDDAINETIVGELFNGVDKLLGGNYNTLAYQRHQIVSTRKLVIDSKNSPTGVPFVIDFANGQYADRVITGKEVYNKTASTGVVAQTQAQEANAKDLIKNLKAMKRHAEHVDHAPRGHFEVAQNTWDEVMALDQLREMYATYTFPTADANARGIYASLVTDDTLKVFFEAQVGAKVVVLDAIGSVEHFDKASGKIVYEDLPAFAEGYFVYVPDGELGTVQFAKPFFMETPEAMTALYDGGRTLLRTLFESKTMSYSIGSEVTALVVPNKVKWMYYFKVDAKAAAI